MPPTYKHEHISYANARETLREDRKYLSLYFRQYLNKISLLISICLKLQTYRLNE